MKGIVLVNLCDCATYTIGCCVCSFFLVVFFCDVWVSVVVVVVLGGLGLFAWILEYQAILKHM